MAKRILVAPLDWGLGHATRCIPIIRALVGRGHQVFLAGEGAAEALLQMEFPQLPFLPLPGYRIRYGASAVQTSLRLLSQLPQIQKAVWYEHRWLQQQMAKYQFDVVISDNRYGLHHPDVHSVFITHQLSIKAPLDAVAWAAQKWMHQHIEKFDCCWVPDVADEPSLAGELSHPKHKPDKPLHYIGPLSRFNLSNIIVEKKGLLLLLSGPEPQRTIFEKLLLEQARNATQAVTLVRGLPKDAPSIDVSEQVTVFNHLPAAELNEMMASAELIICRSGYSTVMDLAALQQKAVLVPTPGQTEQEYLARHLMQCGFAPWVAQRGFDLGKAISMASRFPYFFLENGNDGLLMTALTELEVATNEKHSGL